MSIRATALVVTSLLFLLQDGMSMILKIGVTIDDVAKALNEGKHKGVQKFPETELAMYTLKGGSALRYWRVDEGVLVVQYSKESKVVESINFQLLGPGQRIDRVDFQFVVDSFDTVTELMALKTQSPIEAFRLNEEQMKEWIDRTNKMNKDLEREKESELHTNKGAEQAVPPNGP